MGKTRNEGRRKTKTTAAAKPGFLRLPAELRNVIVELYINDFRARKVHIFNDGTVSGLPLAQTCSQLHSEILPMWAAQLSSGLIYCHVHNFNFHGVSRALQQLSSQAREAISAQRLLRVTLSADDDYTVEHNGIEGLGNWLEDCAAGVIPSRGIYKFTKQRLIKESAFDAIEREVNRTSFSELPDAKKEWGCVRHRYNCALIEYHNIEPYGFRLTKHSQSPTTSSTMGKARKERRLKAATRPSRLLTLPTELLVQIIEYYIKAINEVHILADGSVRALALAQTNRQLHHEVMPIWCAQYLQDLDRPKQIKCLVKNFDFRAVSNIWRQLPDRTRRSIINEELLWIYLAADEDFDGSPRGNLEPWLDEPSTAGGLCPQPIYHFTKPVIKVDAFEAVEDGVSLMSDDRRMAWGSIRRGYGDALLAIHKRQSTGSKMYREWIRCQERKRLEEQERFRQVAYGKFLSLGFR
ncbi:hypothetical protein LTR10_009419 [Elasticomyces elasticus]|nr:hypothetical protein LTR10_009419 [Elasticomyces elasticus]KAK4971482.1 hypothetical protein LTR42_007210 [Elasticomyces elasticus]